MTVVLLLLSLQIDIIVVDAFSSRIAAPVVSSGYFPTPAFRIMNTGEGTVQVVSTTRTTTQTSNNDNENDTTDSVLQSCHCQFAQFGPRLSFEGIMEWAIPATAHLPLQNDPTATAETASQRRREGRILVVKRGLCSFETKMKRAKQVPGVIGVILVNDNESTFVAVADTSTTTTTATTTTGVLQAQEEEEAENDDIPFVVVSSSTGVELFQHDNISGSSVVSVTALEADQSKCYGGWDAYHDNHDNQQQNSFVLPLFPVSKEPLLPGGTLQMQIGQREYEELEYYLQQQQQPGDDDVDDDSISAAAGAATVVYVAVTYCLDPKINVLAETATLAMIDYSAAVAPDKSTASSREDVFAPRPLRMISVKGIEPCHLRTLIRDSTRAGLGLGLIDRCQSSDNNNNNDVASANASAAKEVADKIRTTIPMYAGMDEEDTDLDQSSFDVCRTLLDLPPRQQQAVLACSTLERLQGIQQLVTRLHSNNNNNQKENRRIQAESSNNNPLTTNQNFVATAVKKVLPSIVSVEVSSSSVGGRKGKSTAKKSDEKAAGFFLDLEGIIVTNRHVVAKAIDHTNADDTTASQPPTIVITTQHQGSYPATVLSVSENYDIAFLKIIETNTDTDTDTDTDDLSSSFEDDNKQSRLPSQQQQLFPVASLGNGNTVQLGDWMIAIGSPAEFDIVVSLGIASAIQRPTFTSTKKTTSNKNNSNNINTIVPAALRLLDTSPTFVGTDALFNKGISGGPLINDVGDVVGMCTYLREDLNGLGFAISINRIVDAWEEATAFSFKC